MRKIDGKFHVENDQIVKTSNGEILLEDEPLFLFRARDRLALERLKQYRDASIADGCTDYHLNGINETIRQFAEFAAKNPTRMKQPGITRGL